MLQGCLLFLAPLSGKREALVVLEAFNCLAGGRAKDAVSAVLAQVLAQGEQARLQGCDCFSMVALA